MIAAEYVVADVPVDERHGVFEIFLHGLVVQGGAVEGVDVDGDLAPLPAAQNQIAIHVELVPGNHFLGLLDEPLLIHHEDVHGGNVVGGGGKVHQHIGHIALAVQLHGKIDHLFAVADAGLGDHGDVPAALDMGGDDLGQVDVGKNGGVGHDDQFVIGAVGQEVHGIGQRLQLAAVAVNLGLGVGGQKFQTALLQLQAPLLTVADVVHQGLVVVAGDDADMTDTGAGQIGQRPVHLTVAAAEGQGGHGALDGQLAKTRVVGKYNTGYVHCTFPPVTACHRALARCWLPQQRPWT